MIEQIFLCHVVAAANTQSLCGCHRTTFAFNNFHLHNGRFSKSTVHMFIYIIYIHLLQICWLAQFVERKLDLHMCRINLLQFLMINSLIIWAKLLSLSLEKWQRRRTTNSWLSLVLWRCLCKNNICAGKSFASKLKNWIFRIANKLAKMRKTIDNLMAQVGVGEYHLVGIGEHAIFQWHNWKVWLNLPCFEWTARNFCIDAGWPLEVLKRC